MPLQRRPAMIHRLAGPAADLPVRVRVCPFRKFRLGRHHAGERRDVGIKQTAVLTGLGRCAQARQKSQFHHDADPILIIEMPVPVTTGPTNIHAHCRIAAMQHRQYGQDPEQLQCRMSHPKVSVAFSGYPGSVHGNCAPMLKNRTLYVRLSWRLGHGNPIRPAASGLEFGSRLAGKSALRTGKAP